MTTGDKRRTDSSSSTGENGTDRAVRPSEIDREASRAGVSPNREGKRRRRRMIGASKLAKLVVCFLSCESNIGERERGLKAAGKSFS